MNRPVLLAAVFTIVACCPQVGHATPSSAPSIDIEITEIMPGIHRTAPPHKAKPIKKSPRSYHRVVKPPTIAVKPPPALAPVAAPLPAMDNPDPVDEPAPAPDPTSTTGDNHPHTAAPQPAPEKSKANGE